MKAEYLYLGFGDDRLSSGYRINNDFETVRVGLNYKFH
jgi:opacity protein-like surface antigen